MPRMVFILVGILMVSFLTFGVFASGVLSVRHYSPRALPEAAVIIILGGFLMIIGSGMRRIKRLPWQ